MLRRLADEQTKLALLPTPPFLTVCSSRSEKIKKRRTEKKKSRGKKKQGRKKTSTPLSLLETQLQEDFRWLGQRCSQTHWKLLLINNRLITPARITGELDSLSTPPELPWVGTVRKLCPNPPLKALSYAFFLRFFSLSPPPALNASGRTTLSRRASGFFFQNKAARESFIINLPNVS